MNPTHTEPAQATSSQRFVALEAEDLAGADIAPSSGELEFGAAPATAAAASQTPPGQVEPEASAAPGSAAARPVLIELEKEASGGSKTGHSARRILLRALGVALLAGALGPVAWFVLHRPGVPEETAAAHAPIAAATEPERPADVAEPPAVPPEEASLAGRLRELERQRTLLLAKAEEVHALQEHYRYGVLELEEEAARRIKLKGIETFEQALQQPPIAFALQSIQHRLAYVAGLEKPLAWLASGAEELLYLQRLVEIDLDVLPFAAGIDWDAHAARLEAALTAYRPTAEALAAGADPTAPSLTALFKRTAEQAGRILLPATDEMDAAITEEICAGEMGRYTDLTMLRLKTARCLAESPATELFLNRVRDLPPLAARKLAEWPGDWLCLNGLQEITSEAAGHLFAWPGRWISLNGVSDLPAAVSRHLPAWGGRQIELMGLKRVEAVEHLIRWEEAGGKLFLPQEIRRRVDEGREELRRPPASDTEGRG
jgi:hypothetical protein